MKRLMVIIGAVLYNKGSEALIKGLVDILNKDYIITLVTNDCLGNNVYIDNVENYMEKYDRGNKGVMFRGIEKIARTLKLFDSKIYRTYLEKTVYSRVLSLAESQDCVILVGADNFDSDFVFNYDQMIFAELLLKHVRKNSILYDCSISGVHVSKEFCKMVSGFKHITLRDSLSFDNLRNALVYNNNISLIHDPAFVLSPQKVDNEKYYSLFFKRIGINISNFTTEAKPENKDYFIDLIKHILETTDYRIVLFPHVMNGADLKGLYEIYEPYCDNERVDIFDVETLNANEMKYLISLLDIAIVARTHASIAAYSTCVPTLVVGYSIKSLGIAKDIFGTSDNYVLDGSRIDSELLISKFNYILDNKENIEEELQDKMHSYVENAYGIKELVMEAI